MRAAQTSKSTKSGQGDMEKPMKRCRFLLKRMALRANPIEEEWIIIDEDLEKNTKIQGEGKRLTSRDKVGPGLKLLEPLGSDIKTWIFGTRQGSYAYRVHGLNRTNRLVLALPSYFLGARWDAVLLCRACSQLLLAGVFRCSRDPCHIGSYRHLYIINTHSQLYIII